MSNGVVGFGTIQTEAREVGSFSRISAGGGIHLEVALGSPPSVEVRAQENVVAIIETRVVDGTLRVSSAASFSTTQRTEVAIVTPSLDAISLSDGSQARLSGLAADRFSVDLSDGARLTADGRARQIEIHASNGAQVVMTDLDVTDAALLLSDGAAAEITASGDVTGTATGGSRVAVHGGVAAVFVEATDGSTVES